MTLGRRVLKRVNSPIKSPKLTNSSLRKKTLIKQLSQEIQFGSTSKANLKVVVRVRPENEREIANNARSVLDIVDDHMLVFDPNHDDDDFFFRGVKQKTRNLNKRPHKEQKFIFECVFGTESTNEQVFEKTTKDLVDTVLDGYNCSVFAYGATGAGKTFTMLGKPECPGIAFLTVMELYERIKDVEDSKICEVGVSYLEVYNEMVKDLLCFGGKPLNLHEAGKQVQVSGLSLHKPKDAEELMQLLAEGNRNRTQHATDSNAESSRSHAVFQVFLRQQDKTSGVVSGVSIAKLSMIDLAGSERGAATGFTGARFREGASINRSLLALGNCINALADGKCHIPYRDSKLTRLLKDSLGGNCRSVMIAAVSRASTSFEDTFNTLRYAHRAKTIKTTLKKNLMNVDQHVSQYLKIVGELRTEVGSLNEKIKQMEEKAEAEEETIKTLQMQLEIRSSFTKEENVEEKFLLNQFQEMHSQLKAYQREALQLEFNERELKYKIYSHQLQSFQMKIFSSVTRKLDKGLAKTERSLTNFKSRLEHIQKRKPFLYTRIDTCKSNIRSICEQLKTFSCEKDAFTESTGSIIELNDLQLKARDSAQMTDYLEGIAKGSLNSQIDHSKLNLLLLHAATHFYVKLRSVNETDSESDEIFQNLLSMVDSSRLEWEDQKRTEESFGEEIVSKYLPAAHPTIDTQEMFNLPLLNSFSLSPLTVDTNRCYRRSIMKSSFASAAIGMKASLHPLASLKEQESPLLTPERINRNSPVEFEQARKPIEDPLLPLIVEESAQSNAEDIRVNKNQLSSTFDTDFTLNTRQSKGTDPPVAPGLSDTFSESFTVAHSTSERTAAAAVAPPEKKNLESTFCIPGEEDVNGTFSLPPDLKIIDAEEVHLNCLSDKASVWVPPPVMPPPSLGAKSGLKRTVSVSNRNSIKVLKPSSIYGSAGGKTFKKSVSVSSLHKGGAARSPIHTTNSKPSKGFVAFGSSLRRTSSYFRLKGLHNKNQENIPPKRTFQIEAEKKYTPRKVNPSLGGLSEGRPKLQ